MPTRKFEEQVAKTPDRIALKIRENWITYKTLNEYAHRTARAIADKWPRDSQENGPETVGLLFEHGEDMIAAMLGALKAGKAYVPLPADYPPNRLSYILTHSQAALILTHTPCESAAGELAAINRLPFIDILRTPGAVPRENSRREFTGNEPAYIMYTSGSTGRPKGVMQTRKNVSYFAGQWVRVFSITEEDRMTLFSSFCHDGSQQDIYSALLNGASLYPLDMKKRDGTENLTQLLLKEKISIWHSVPSLYSYFVNTMTGTPEFEALRFIALGGEAVRSRDVEMFKRYFPHSVLANVYGQTESSVNSIHLIHPGDTAAKITIGTPLEGIEIFLVDDEGNEVDPLRSGEILIASPHITPGYWRDEETTAKHMDTDDQFGRLYWTGDSGRLLLDGGIEYTGRKDSQVKIRGFRIEPGEIESFLLSHPEVTGAVVTVRENRRGEPYLCAYFVAAADSPGITRELRELLAKNVPDYMMPSFFTRLEGFPLTGSGKIDRRGLPEPGFRSTGEQIKPADEIERVMAGVWAEVLDIPPEAVSMLDNFFEVGGHSLKATVLVSRVHKVLDVEVPLPRVFKTPTLRGLCEYIKKTGTAGKQYTHISPAEKKEYDALSPAQKRLHILHQMDPQGTGYNMPKYVVMAGEPETEKLRDTFLTLIRRHESLRTSFHLQEGVPVQRIHDTVDLEIQFISRPVSQFVRPFDLSHAPLMRVGILPLEESQYLLMVDIHHIVTDGTSQRILVEDFTALFSGKELPALTLGYRDYVLWWNSREQQAVVRSREAYWLEEFSGEIPVLNLPSDFSRPAVQSFEGRGIAFSLTAEETRGLNALARGQGATLYMVLVSIVYVLMSKLSGREDIVLGTVAAGRGHADLERVIGMFVNTLALRNRIPGDRAFAEFLTHVKEKTLKAFENQEYPFEVLVEKVNVVRDTGRNPLFDVMFTLQNMGDFGGELPGEQPGENPRNVTDEHRTVKFDLTLIAAEVGERLGFILEYCTRLFKPETAERFITYLKNIAASVLEDPQRKISDIVMLSEEERNRILYDFNNTASEYPRDKTLHELFEEQVLKAPDAIALNMSNTTYTTHMTYNELNRNAGRLASLLREKGVGPDTIVGIKMERSPDMIVGLMGILKAGGAYLPIDPEYPQERIDYMLKDSNAKIHITSCRDAIYRVRDQFGRHKSNPGMVGSQNLAYIIYTSGSTGKPKGVMVEHTSAVNILWALQKKYPLLETDAYLLKTSYAFDVSVAELFGWFLGAGRLAVLEKGAEKEPRKIYEAIKRYRVTHINFVPTMFNVFVELLTPEQRGKLSTLKYIFLAGEALLPEMVERFARLETGIPLKNIYGPTEATIYAAGYSLCRWSTGGPVPIGSPMPNVRLTISDKAGNLQPIGVPGELHISGTGLARGYLNNPELTAEKFSRGAVPTNSLTPYPLQLTPLLYRTGDLTRWLPDGNIEFLGRIDHQVKIRGFRIEPGEIENQLLKRDDIDEAVVSAREDKSGNRFLCAYVVARGELDIHALRTGLSKSLPDYMVPSYFISLEKIPLTPNGKVDTKRLPVPGIEAGDDTIAPKGEIEEKLAGMWADVLAIDKNEIGIDANFFELGGHSLRATILVFRIHKEFDVKIPLTEVFKTLTIRALAEYIKRRRRERYAAIKPVEKRDRYPLSPAQRRLFVLHRMEPETVNYNIPLLLPMEGEIDIKRLKTTFQKIIARHESLRTSFVLVENEPVQRIHDNVEFEIQLCAVTSQFIAPFDLSRAPLIRAGIRRFEENRYLLMVDTHHIVSDGTSQTILMDEFQALYNGKELSPSRLQYKDYAQWQSGKEQQEAVRLQERYWLEEFSGEIPVLNLPLDFPRPAVQSFEGRSIGFSLSAKQTRELNELASRESASLYMVLSAVFNILLSKLSGREDIVTGVVTAGRRHADLECIIGMFVNTLALRNVLHGQQSFTAFLREVKTGTLNAFENQEYPFEMLVEKVDAARDAGRNPLFDVMFILQNIAYFKGKQPGTQGDTSKKRENPDYENRVTKFDLTLTGVEAGDCIRLDLRYCTRLFKEETIERFIVYFKRIIHTVLDAPGLRISEIDILPEDERERLLYDFNDTASEYPRDKTLHELFEEQVLKAPDAIALNMSHKTHTTHMTYNELNRNADRLASLLREKGVGPDTIVGIKMERSPEMIAGIMGILKAGGAYLPIDPQYPDERIDYILKDSSAKIHIISCRDAIYRVRDQFGRHKSDPGMVGSQNLAYIIYTSGSTGKPKGVPIRHRGIVNLVVHHRDVFDVNPGSRMSQVSSPGFDAMALEVWPCLLSGAALYIADNETRPDPARMKTWLIRMGITISFQSTVIAELLLDGPWPAGGTALRVLLTGGDRLTRRPARRYPFTLYNLYGPTEDTIVTTWTEVPIDPGAIGPPAIGKPVANHRVLIAGPNMELQPIGVPGELCIAGEGLSPGYLNNPELTAEKFCRDAAPSNSLTPLLYRTGDLTRWLPDGNIEFLGRIDHQVKIRGFRIELGEIENGLLKHPGVKDAVVRVLEKEDGDRYLCAYIIPQPASLPDAAELKEYLSLSMPVYMIPSSFVELEKMPLNPNGKIDIKALPKPSLNVEAGHAAPADEVEEKLAEIWARVLNVEKKSLGVTTNFFDLGGHSLKATITVSMIHKAFNVKIPLAGFFHLPTIRGLSTIIKQSVKETFMDIVPVEKTGYYALSYNQTRLWRLYKKEPETTAFNMPDRITWDSPVDVDVLKESLLTVMRRHDSLRTGFIELSGNAFQFVKDPVHPADVPFTQIDISHLKVEERNHRRRVLLENERRVPFDLSRPPLFRVLLVKWAKTGEAGWDFIYNIHHLVNDGWSMNIMKRDFLTVYDSLRAGKEPRLDPLPLRYRDFVAWETRRLNDPALTKDSRRFWAKKLGDGIPEFRLPRDFEDKNNSREGAEYRCKIDAGLKNRLGETAKRENITLFTLMFSSFLHLFSGFSNREEVTCTIIDAGREHVALENIIGFFVNRVLFQTRVPAGEKTADFIRRINREVLEVFQHKSYPHEYVCNELKIKNPDIPIAFNMLNIKDNSKRELKPFAPYHIPDTQEIKFDMEAYITEYKNGIEIRWAYRKGLYKPETIEYLSQEYIKRLEYSVENTDKGLDDGISLK